jgi:hypothetical protein
LPFSCKAGAYRHAAETDAVAATLHHVSIDASSPQSGAPTISATEVVSISRPSLEVFKAQMTFIDQYADLREERAGEILAQAGPQNAFWSSIVNLHPSRNPKTLELLDAVTRFAVIVEMRFKHALGCYRPNEFSPQTQPMLLTPGHGSLPSGHSTQAYAIARVLRELCGAAEGTPVADQLERQAGRVAINRTIAGLHFPVDSACGRMLGTTLAEYLICRGSGEEAYTPRRFDGAVFDGDTDFSPHEALDSSSGVSKLAGAQAGVSKPFGWLWHQAKHEWDGQAQAASVSKAPAQVST